MDDKWFKQQQKRAGVTAEKIGEALGKDRSLVSRIYTGRQRMKLDEAKIFARVLDLPLGDVLEHAGLMDPEAPAASRPRGFAESGDASPFKLPDRSDAPDRLMALAMGGDRPGVDIWRATSRALELEGILPGDFLLVDTHQSERAKAGDIVIAQVYDWQSGGATTVLRRYDPPVLTARTMDPAEKKVHVVDHSNVVIAGKVTGSWRKGSDQTSRG